MRTHPSSEQHQWEGCKGLADLAARDSDGLSAVRRQGGIQVLLLSVGPALGAPDEPVTVYRYEANKINRLSARVTIQHVIVPAPSGCCTFNVFAERKRVPHMVVEWGHERRHHQGSTCR